jgi:hypothetical protein
VHRLEIQIRNSALRRTRLPAIMLLNLGPESMPALKRSAPLLVFCVWAAMLPPAIAQEDKPPLVPTKVLQSDTVYVDCSVCPRGLAVAQKTAFQALRAWGRFRVLEDHKHADLIFLFSANPYLGDYITRDGPDQRPVSIEFTIMTVIDPQTGKRLWTDWRRYGSLRVASATKDLIEELRNQMEDRVKRWTLDDILACSHTPAYLGFASLTAEEALSRSDWHVERVPDSPDRLALSSADAPEFCRQARLVVGPDNKIAAFEVVVSEAEALDVGDVLERADEFDFKSGKYAQSEKVYFSARDKIKNVRIQFSMEGHRAVLSLVTYTY